MPRVVWCNLDPEWPFARMVRDHCIDWVVRDDVRIWDVRQPREATQSPWDDWPVGVAPQALADALDELPSAPSDGRLLAFHLPQKFDEAGTTRAFLATCAQRLKQLPGWTLMLSLPEQTDLTPFQAEPFGARLIARLSDDPRRRIQSQRLLIEMMLNPTLVEDLERPGGLALFDVTLRAEDRQPVLDRVAVQWNAALPEVLRQIEALERPVASSQVPEMHLVAQTLNDVPQLRDDTRIPASDTPVPGLEIRVPGYRDLALGDRLHQARIDFLTKLDNEMKIRWMRLSEWRAEFLADCRQQDQRLDDALDAVSVMDVGFSDPGRERLDTWRIATSDQIRDTADQSEALAQAISRDVRLPGNDEGAGYVRHRFAEDEAFDASIDAAIRVGRQLIRGRSILLGGLLVSLAAAIPVLIMRVPAWLDGGLPLVGALSPGLRDYLATPPLWWFDLAWVLIPGLVFWIAGFLLARRRRRDLDQALAEAQVSAERLWQRHAGVLDDMARYVSHTATMRRLSVLRIHLDRLDQGVRAGRRALEAMASELHRQGRDYRQLNVPAARLAQRLEGKLAQAVQDHPHPLRWLRALVSSVGIGEPQEVRVRDDRYPADRRGLVSDYPVGQVTLHLRQVTQP